MPSDPSPIARNSAFGATTMLKNASEAAAEITTADVWPDQAFVGSTAAPPPNQVRLNYRSPAGRSFIDLSQSLIRVRCRFAANAAFTVALDAAIAGQNNAISQYGAANLFDQVTFRIGGKVIQTVNEHAVATSMLYESLASDSALNSGLSLVWAQPLDSDRAVAGGVGGADYGNVQRFDLWYRPAISAFFTPGKLLRCGGASFELQMNLHPDWSQRMMTGIESYATSTASRVPRPTLANGRVQTISGVNFHVGIESLMWRVQQAIPTESLSISDADVLDTSALTIIPADLSVAATSNLNLVIPPDSYKVMVGLQAAAAGTNGQLPITEFQHLNATDIRLVWSGKTLPSTPYELDFVAGPVSEGFYDFLRSTNQIDKGEGSSMDERRWRSRKTVYAFPLASAQGAKSTNMRVQLMFNAATAAGDRAVFGFVSPLRVFLGYDGSGRMTSVAVSEENISAEIIMPQ